MRSTDANGHPIDPVRCNRCGKLMRVDLTSQWNWVDVVDGNDLCAGDWPHQPLPERPSGR
jgi:hypothetical protein